MHEALCTVACLNEDVPCWTCEYNLRGLASRGRCPECGSLIGVSVAAHQHRRKTLGDADPAWLRHLVEGAWLALAVWFIVLALCVTPERFRDWLFEFRSPQRRVALGIACTWWTLAWAAVWKLARPEPAPAEARTGRLIPLVRAAATAFLLLPMLVGLADVLPLERSLVLLVFFLFACGCAAALALWLRVWNLASRDQRIILQAQSCVLAVASPVALWYAVTIARSGRTDSLSMMTGLPLPGIGWPAIVADAFEYPAWFFGDPHPGAVFLLAHSTAAFVALVHVLLMLISARRRAFAGAARRSSTSSVP